MVSSWVIWVSRLIALEIFPSHRIRGFFFSFLWHGVWSWQLFVYGQLLG